MRIVQADSANKKSVEGTKKDNSWNAHGCDSSVSTYLVKLNIVRRTRKCKSSDQASRKNWYKENLRKAGAREYHGTNIFVMTSSHFEIRVTWPTRIFDTLVFQVPP